MTNHDWAVANLPGYALHLARVRGRVRVYSIWQFGVMRSCPCIYRGQSDDTHNRKQRVEITIARRGEPLTMRQVDRRNVWTVQEWRERRRNA